MKNLFLIPFLFLFISYSFGQSSLDSLRLVMPQGHTREITKTLETSKFIISSSLDSYVKVWDKKSCKLLFTNKSSKGGINDIVFDSIRNSIIFGSEDSVLYIWKLDIERLSSSVKSIRMKDRIYKILLNEKDCSYYIQVGRKTISKWNLKTLKLIWKKEISKGEINTIELNRYTNKLFVLLFDGNINVLDLNSRKHKNSLNVYNAHKAAVYKFFPYDKENYYTTSFDGELTWWNDSLIGGRKNFNVSNVVLNDIKVYKNTLLTGSCDGFLYFLNLRDSSLNKKIKFEDWVISICISNDAKSAFAIDTRGNLKSINLSTGEVEKEISIGENITSITLSDNGREIYCNTYSGDIILINSFTFKIKAILLNQVNEIYSLNCSKNGTIVTANVKSNYNYIDILNNYQFEYKVSGVTDVTYPNKSQEYLLANDNSIHLLNFNSLENVKSLKFEENLVTLAGFSKSGKYPFVVYRDLGLYLLDDDMNNVLKKIPKISGYNYILTCEFLNNDSIIAIGETEGGLSLTDIFSNKSFVIDLKLEDPIENKVFFIQESSENDFFICVSSHSINKIKTKSGEVLIQKTFKNRIISACIIKSKLYLLYSNNDIQLFELKDFTFKNSLQFDINITKIYNQEEKLLLKSNDGNLYFLNDDFEIKLSYLSLKNNNWLIKLSNSPYYMCSKDASKMLHYVTPSLKVIGFEQLDPVYNRPDIVLDSIGMYLGNSDRGMIENYRIIWDKRIDRLGLDKEKLGKGEIAVPSAEIIGAENIAYENKDGKLNISISAHDLKYTLRSFNVFVNEVPLYGSAGISIAHLDKNKWDTVVSVPLSIGDNKIQVSVMNELGLENFKYPTYVNYIPNQNIVSKTFFIGIGVNEFIDSKHNLKYCVKDVTDLSDRIKNSNSIVKLYTNSTVTRENILGLKDYLNKNTTINDKVIISCSSHGLLDDSLNFYLAMHDVDFDNPKKRGLKYEELENLLDGIPARQKLLFLDACNSGENDKTEILKQELKQKEISMDSTQILAARGVIVKFEEENKSNFKKMNELFVNVRNNTGAVIISAAGGQESALEAIEVDGEEIENGAFTYSILECLELNKGKELKVNQLKQYTEKRVEQITKGKQRPTSRQETMEIDWNVR